MSLVYDFVKGMLIGIYFSLFHILHNLRMQRHRGLQMRPM